MTNQLLLKSQTPTAQLATPAGLSINFFNQGGNETIFSPNPIPRQVVGPQLLADITVLSDYKFQIALYPVAAKGSKDPSTGLYAPSGSPTKVILVENPDHSSTIYNRIHITESDGSGLVPQRDYLYIYTGGYPIFDPAGQWELVSQGGLRHETLLAIPIDANDRAEVRTIADDAGRVVSKVRKQYHTYTWGEEVTSEIVDPDGAALTTTYDYWHVDVPDPGNPPPDPYAFWANHLKSKVDPNGHWTRYEYDDSDRPTKVTEQFLDVPITTPDNQCRVTTTTYNDNQPLTETEVQTLQGVEVSRRYTRYLGGGRKQEIVCQHPGVAIDAADNLVTTTVTDQNGNVLLTQRPDGTLSTYGESVTDTQKTTVSATGASSADGTAVVDGTQTTTVTDSGGHQLLQTVQDLASGLTLSSATTTQADSLGRPTQVTYVDGSTELTGYDCCGVASRTDRDGVSTTYTNDAFGHVTGESRAGVTTLYTYDAAGRRLSTSRQGSDGSKITVEKLTYDVAGRQTGRTDGLGRTTGFAETIDPATGHTVRTTTMPDPTHSTRVETSLQDGSLLSLGGTAAHPLLYAYGADATAGAWRQEIKVGDGGAASEWTMSYTDAAGRDYRTLTAAGAVSQSFFNAQGQLVRSVDPDGVSTLFGYNARGEQDTVAVDLDGNGQIDLAGTDRVTRTARTVLAAHNTTVSRTTVSAWTINGQDAPAVVSVDDQSVDGRRAWHTDAGGLTTASGTACDGAGGCTTTVTAPDGAATVQVTGQGRALAQTRLDANGQTLSGTTMDYDPQGRLWHQSDRRDGPTEFTYDAADELRRVSHQGQTTGYDYDALGRKTLETEPDLAQVQTEYWPTGEVRSVGGARTYPQGYTYDAQGRLQTLTTTGAAGAEVTTWHYDPQSGQMVFKAYADGKGPRYTYTPAGRLATRTWARGIVTTYGYDGAGQLASISYSDGTTPPAAYTYDRLGRLASASGGGSARALAYQGSTSLLASESYTAGPLAGVAVNTGYDALLRRAGLQVNQGQTSLVTQSFGFDAVSRLASASQGTAGAAYTYYPDSATNLVQSITFTNNASGSGGNTQPVMTTTKTYDLLDRLTGISSTVAGASAPVSGYGYTYNAANQRVRADVAADGSHWLYGYDDLGQVTGASRQWSDDTLVAGQQYGYGYDQIGNRTSATTNGRQSLYTSNARNQYSQRTVPGTVDVTGTANPSATVTLNQQPTTRQNGGYFAGSIGVDNSQAAVDVPVDVAVVQTGTSTSGANTLAEQKGNVFLLQTPEQFGYDADGNIIQDGRWMYTWDGENRLVGMEALTSLPTANHKKLVFGYDDKGRRVQKQVWNAGSGGYQPSSSTLFVYDGWNLAAESDGTNNGALLRSYLWGLDLSGSMQGAGGVGGLLAVTDYASTNGAESHFACPDGNGNVVALVKAADASVSARYQYGSFGEALRVTGANIAQANPIRWSSKYTDSESGLSYYGYRFYNEGTGRWTSRDPLEEGGGLNIYGFVVNSPCTRYDPDGRQDLLLPDMPEPGDLPGMQGPISLLNDFMNGTGSSFQEFGPGTWLSNQMRNHPQVNKVRNDLKRVLRDHCKQNDETAFEYPDYGHLTLSKLPWDMGWFSYSLGGFQGTVNGARDLVYSDLYMDYSRLIMGSFSGRVLVWGIHCCDKKANLTFTLWNDMSAQSMGRLPVLGYINGGYSLYSNRINGPYRTIHMEVWWDETITF